MAETIAYHDGDVIPQVWHGGFIFLAYLTALIGSYSAIRILEHGLWRSEQEKQNATLISRCPRFATAFVLGSCGIWSMHFIGMQAVELQGIDMCYNWLATVGSLFLAVGGVWAGVAVAQWDVFSGQDRFEILKQMILHDQEIEDHKVASWHVHQVAFFDMLHWIAAGSILAALGALSMHFLGMIAMVGPFHREWNFSYIAASIFVGVVVCFAGFWILFRPLHWKVEKSWYRQASAVVIAAAVCFLHFLGMLSVTYIADSTQGLDQCSGSLLMGWKGDQFQVLCVAMAVPIVAFLVEHTISSELRVTYRQLLDVRLTGSEFLEEEEALPTKEKEPVKKKRKHRKRKQPGKPTVALSSQLEAEEDGEAPVPENQAHEDTATDESIQSTCRVDLDGSAKTHASDNPKAEDEVLDVESGIGPATPMTKEERVDSMIVLLKGAKPAKEKKKRMRRANTMEGERSKPRPMGRVTSLESFTLLKGKLSEIGKSLSGGKLTEPENPPEPELKTNASGWTEALQGPPKGGESDHLEDTLMI